MRSIRSLLRLFVLGACATLATAQADPVTVQINVEDQPLNQGRIDPMLFGNFVELLDDVVPGMWAELLNDRSFEGIIPPANWCYYDGSLDICDRPWDTNATWSVDAQSSFNGSRCARLGPGTQGAVLTQSGLTVKKGMDYLFSGYLKTESKTRVTVALKCLLPSGEWTTLGSQELPILSPTWRKYNARILCKGQSDRAVFELRTQGKSTVWADKLSLMPKDNLQGWRPDVVQAIRAVKPAVIRWGGSSVDPGRYRWKQGIGSRDLRVPWRNENWGRIDPNDVGIDEFCQFCELVGSEPLVCVSFADGPQSAGDLVEYCNGESSGGWGAKRAQNGHPNPYGVKFWQIGNEIGGDNPAYLAGIPSFIQTIRRADPNAQIMSSFPHPKLLESVGKDLAFVCPHHYTPDLQACARDFDSLSQLLDSLPGCERIKVGVTEWNIDAGSWGLGRGKQATLGAALMNARYLHVLMRHSDKVRIACRSNLANSFCGAIIETGARGDGVLKRASYYVMQLYATHAQPLPLKVSANSSDLDVFSCEAETKRSGAVFLVNPQPAPVSTTFKLPDSSWRISGAEAVADVQDAGQPDIMNHWQTPERIRILRVPSMGNQVTLRPLSATVVEWLAR